jgi:Ser/Thr protein kinase RdoA (MazF antagonist)
MVLRAVSQRASWTPTLVATDEKGLRCDVPAVLMTRLPGSPHARPLNDNDFIHGMVDALLDLHCLGFKEDRVWRPYEPHHAAIPHCAPEWAQRPREWGKAVEVFRQPLPIGFMTLLHRDYHAGNVLWRRDKITGIVDWVNASWGVTDADVGHCRFNLVTQLGLEQADTFLRLYLAKSGRVQSDYDPFWDIAAAIGGIPDLHSGTPKRGLLDLESFILKSASSSRRR